MKRGSYGVCFRKLSYVGGENENEILFLKNGGINEGGYWKHASFPFTKTETNTEFLHNDEIMI